MIREDFLYPSRTIYVIKEPPRDRGALPPGVPLHRSKSLPNEFFFRSFQLIRCFLWLVVELGQVWDSEFELTGSVIGSGSEVDEIFESSGHSFC